jgi:hypothetical protein
MYNRLHKYEKMHCSGTESLRHWHSMQHLDSDRRVSSWLNCNERDLTQHLSDAKATLKYRPGSYYNNARMTSQGHYCLILQVVI